MVVRGWPIAAARAIDSEGAARPVTTLCEEVSSSPAVEVFSVTFREIYRGRPSAAPVQYHPHPSPGEVRRQ